MGKSQNQSRHKHIFASNATYVCDAKTVCYITQFIHYYISYAALKAMLLLLVQDNSLFLWNENKSIDFRKLELVLEAAKYYFIQLFCAINV